MGLFAIAGSIASARAATWAEVTGQDTPKVVALSASEKPPINLPFIPERMRESGFWQAYSEPKIVGKLAETMAKSTGAGWTDSGMWMHSQGPDGKWVSLAICQTERAAQGGVRSKDGIFGIHQALWKNLQATRPQATKGKEAATPSAKPKTGAFTVNLGEMQGTAQTPDDRKVNPFLKYDGDAAKEEAQLEVPTDYDGSKPYGLMVFISTGKDGNNGMPGGWRKDLQSNNMIWIGPKNGGNNHPGVRRVWLAQQARAWALHHYKIDPARMIISGFSNGGDSASATAVATPFGFNSAILFAPPCDPPLGTVAVPQETDAKGAPVNFIKPLSSAGISHIKKNWRIAYVCGSNDKFLADVKRSAKAVEDLDAGSKLFEIAGLGHSIPGNIAEIMGFIFSPRESSDAKRPGREYDPAPVLSSIRSGLKTNPVKAREIMLQLWNNHPEVRANQDVSALIAEMEALP